MAATSSAVRAGRAFVEIFADDSKLQRGLKAAEGKLRKFGDNLQKAGMKLAGAGLGVDAVFGIGAKQFADFETQMAAVSTMLDKPQEHMERFTAAIKKMSVEFGEGTDVLAKGLYDLLSSAIAPADALGVLEVAVRAAKAGITDTATSALVLTNVLNAFHLPASRAADVADFLFQTVKLGVTTFPELAEHLGQVTSIAYAAGLSLDEMGAALALLTKNGMKTDVAVTALKGVVAEFLKPSDEGAETAKKLGIAMNTATIRSEGLLGVFQKLQGVSEADIAKMFPDIRGLAGAFSAIKDVKGFESFLGQIGQRAGATGKAFATMDATLNATFSRIKQTGIAVMRELGEAIAKPFQATLETVVKYGNGLVEIMAKHRDVLLVVDQAAIGIVALGAACITASLAFKIFAPAVALAGVALKALAAAFGLLLTPLGAVVVAIGAATAAVLYFTGTGSQMIAGLTAGFKQLWADATAAFEGIAAAIAAGNIEAAWQIVTLFVQLEWARVVGTLTDIWYGFVTVFETVIDSVVNNTLTAADTVVNVWRAGIATVLAVLGEVGETGANIWAGIKAAALDAAAGIWNSFAGIYNRVAGLIAKITGSAAQLELMETQGVGAAFSGAMGEAQKDDTSFRQKQLDATAGASTLREQFGTDLAKGSTDRHAAVLTEQQEKVAKLQAELAKAVAAAQGQKPGVGPVEGAAGGAKGETKPEKAAEGAAETAKTAVAGTFSAAGAAGLGGGKVDEKILKENQKQNELLKRLVKKMERGGWTEAFA